ncbi:hypothetical protein TL16_g00674 [Triparma laevis f. inornata]|uniref:Ion transport domain-containing protein n=1 Tax=Triparma laevis f. inornata TaxID=1714386 RepID=A0A9W6ZF98_9STRA|nr:hypothetical protein TL16_g00674 [Triparma laevis f. inornata]
MNPLFSHTYNWDDRQSSGPLQPSEYSSGEETPETAEPFEQTLFEGEMCVVKGNERSRDERLKKDHQERAKMTCLEVSPDGRYIFTGGSDGYLYILDKWEKKSDDPQSPTQYTKRVKITDKKVNCITYQQNMLEDGDNMYVGTNEDGKDLMPGLVVVLNLSSFEVVNTFQFHINRVTGLAVTQACDVLISVSRDKKALFRDLSNTHNENVIEEGNAIRCIDLSPGSDFVCLGGGDNSKGFVHVYNTVSKELLVKLVGHPKGVLCLAFSRDGRKIFSGSWDASIKIWDISSNDPEKWTLHKTLIGQTRDVYCISESHCGGYLCSGSSGTINIWDMNLGFEVRTIKLKSMGDVMGINFGIDHGIVSVADDGLVRLWTLPTRGKTSLKLKSEHGPVISVAIGSDDQTLVSGSKGGTVQIWNIQHESMVTELSGHLDSIESVDISKDIKLALSGSADKKIILWDLEGYTELKKIDFGDKAFAVKFTPDEKSLFAGGKSGTLKQFSVESGELIRDFRKQTGNVMSLCISNDGKTLITAVSKYSYGDGCNENSIDVWDIDNQNKIISRQGHTNTITDVSLSPDQTKIISASHDKTAKLWDLATGKLLHTFEGGKEWIKSVSFHPSGEYIVLGSLSFTIWSIRPPYCPLYTFSDHKDKVYSLTFTSDGNKVISGSKDSSINITDIEAHIQFLPFPVHSQAFEQDCVREEESTGEFSWGQTAIMGVLQHSPLSLLESDFPHSKRNIVHVAAEKGKGDFLASCLIVDDDGIPEDTDKGIIDWKTRQKIAILSTLQRDEDGQTPLAKALRAESGSVIKVIFDVYALLLSQEYALPFQSECTFEELHPMELFPLDELVDALSQFAPMALTFISQLSLISPGDHRVQKGVVRHPLGSTKRIRMGSDVRVPKDFWRNQLRKPNEFGRIPPERGLPVTAKLVPIKGIAQSDSKFLRSVTDACYVTKRFTAFENEVVQTLIEFKWKTYGRNLFFYHLKLGITLVFFLTTDALIYKSVSASNSIAIKILGNIPMLITSAIWSFFARHEYHQYNMAGSLKEHIQDFWNFLDCISLASIFAAYVFRVLEWIFGSVASREGAGLSGSYWSTLMLAIALPLAWLNTLYFMQGFHESGRLVRMIIGIIKGIRVFLAILTVCMFGFAAGFFLILEGSFGHTSPLVSVFSSYTLLLGEYDLENLDRLNNDSEFTMTKIMFVCFTMLLNIIMLNLLIAIMGDIFDKIQENAKAEFLFARANIILEFEDVLTKKQKENREWFPVWLQVLVPTLKSTEMQDGDWVGRVRALKDSVNTVRQQLDESEKKREMEVKILNSRYQDVERKLEESENKRAHGEQELKRLLNIICDNLSIPEGDKK